MEGSSTCFRHAILNLDVQLVLETQGSPEELDSSSAGSSREATSLMQADEEEPQQGPNLARDIRRPPSRARTLSYRGQGQCQ